MTALSLATALTLSISTFTEIYKFRNVYTFPNEHTRGDGGKEKLPEITKKSSEEPLLKQFILVNALLLKAWPCFILVKVAVDPE